MDAYEFIEFSGKVVTSGKAGARSAVSRAYYGAFHLALELLDSMGCAPPANGSSHNHVPTFLKCSTHEDAIAAANLLSDLHSDRVKVDYRLDNADVETTEFAMLGVEMASTIRQRLQTFQNACVQESVSRELKDGVAQLRARRQI